MSLRNAVREPSPTRQTEEDTEELDDTHDAGLVESSAQPDGDRVVKGTIIRPALRRVHP